MTSYSVPVPVEMASDTATIRSPSSLSAPLWAARYAWREGRSLGSEAGLKGGSAPIADGKRGVREDTARSGIYRLGAGWIRLAVRIPELHSQGFDDVELCRRRRFSRGYSALRCNHAASRGRGGGGLRLKSERLQLRYGPLRSDGPFRSLHLVGRCGHRTRQASPSQRSTSDEDVSQVSRDNRKIGGASTRGGPQPGPPRCEVLRGLTESDRRARQRHPRACTVGQCGGQRSNCSCVRAV